MDEIEWWEFDTPAELAEQAAGDIAFVIESAVEAHGGARIAIGAGGAADTVLKTLAADRSIAWDKVAVLPTDEGADETAGPIAKALARTKARIVPLGGEERDAAAAARAADARIAELGGPLDLVLLTAGPDGRIAGIVPGGDVEAAVAGPRGRSVAAIGAGGSAPRLTLTADAIARARAVMLVVTGAEARAAVERAIADGPLSSAPAGRVLAAVDTSMDIFWTA